MSARKRTARLPLRVRPLKKDDVPATKKMVDHTRAELKSESTSLRLEMKSGFKKIISRMDARFAKADERFAKVDERLAQMDARFDRLEARFDHLEARFDRLEARFDHLEARFDRLEARFDSMDVRFSNLEAMIHRVIVLVEEQNARNVFVLDGYASLDHRLLR